MASTESRLLAMRFSKEELEAMLDTALRELTGGKTVTSWTVGDSSAEKQAWLNAPPERRAKMIGEALCIKDPVMYPPDDVIPITQTRVVFSSAIDSSEE